MIRMLRAEIEQELGVNKPEVFHSKVLHSSGEDMKQPFWLPWFSAETSEKLVIRQEPVKTKRISGQKSSTVQNKIPLGKNSYLKHMNLENINYLEQNNDILQVQLAEILKSLDNLIG